eukprot:357844-Chlamydomonas_euryale.AAC.4
MSHDFDSTIWYGVMIVSSMPVSKTMHLCWITWCMQPAAQLNYSTVNICTLSRLGQLIAKCTNMT